MEKIEEFIGFLENLLEQEYEPYIDKDIAIEIIERCRDELQKI